MENQIFELPMVWWLRRRDTSHSCPTRMCLRTVWYLVEHKIISQRFGFHALLWNMHQQPMGFVQELFEAGRIFFFTVVATLCLFFSMRLFHNFYCRFCHTSRQPNFLQIFLPKFAPAHVPISKSDFIISFKCQIVLRNTSSSSIMWSCTQLTCWVMNSNRYIGIGINNNDERCAINRRIFKRDLSLQKYILKIDLSWTSSQCGAHMNNKIHRLFRLALNVWASYSQSISAH